MSPLFHILRLLLLAVLSFALAMAWTPILSWLLYKFGVKKRVRDTGATPIFSALHAHKSGTPTMGGLVIWITVLIVTIFFWFLGSFFPEAFAPLNFLTRSETWLPLFALVAAALVGVTDDLFNVWGIGPQGGGLKMRHRIIIYLIIAAAGAWWFTVKLGFNAVEVPLVGSISLGIWYSILFCLVIVATAFSVNEVDGLDGLAGGVLLILFMSYIAIAFTLGRYDLAAFISVIVGALLAFLWFNIYPARFIMGDTGAMSLGVVLGIIAMLTDTSLLLPVLGFVLVIESVSVILQMASKKIFKRKLFLSTPFHHHLEASGWPEPKVVMRLWLVSAVMSMLGLAFFLMDRAL